MWQTHNAPDLCAYCCHFIVAGHAEELAAALSQGGTHALNKILLN